MEKTLIFIMGLAVGIILNGFLWGMAIKNNHEFLSNKKKLYKRLLENSQDIVYYYQIYPKEKFRYVSPSVRNMLGRHESEFYDDPNLVFTTVHPEDELILKQKVYGHADYSKPIITRWLHADGHYIWTEDRAIPICNKEGKMIAVEGSVRDISERKKLEDELEYKRTHDSMTGIYNREYFEEYFDRYDNCINDKVGLIICDLNELKFANDNFGHKKGDLLIIEAANLLNKFSSKKTIVSRIGGDEFALLSIGESEEYTKILLDKINEGIIELNNRNKDTKINISIGYAFSNNSLENMNALFKEADEKMYNNKRTAYVRVKV